MKKTLFDNFILFLIVFVIFSACNGNKRDSQRNGESETKIAIKIPKIDIDKIKVNVYIENSGSMNGYINASNSEFKQCIGSLLTDLPYTFNKDSIEVFYINEQIYKQADGNKLNDFINNISNKTFNVGKTTSSDINKIFGMILEKTNKNTISILYSDFIYSIDGKSQSEIIDLLNSAKYSTKSAFMQYSKNNKSDLITSLYRYTSSFNGTYYNWKNGKEKISNKRPYFICVIGEKEIVSELNKNIDFDKYSGFTNNYTLSSSTFDIYYSVLLNTNNSNGFKPSRKDRNDNTSAFTRSIELGKRSRRNQNSNLQLSVVVDLSSIPIDNQYLNNPQNYYVNPDFKLIKTESYNKNNIHPSDYKMIFDAKINPTHVLTFSSVSNNFQYLEFGLKNNIKNWISKYSNENDENTKVDSLKLNQTFGISFLIGGIYDAYYQINNKNEFYFKNKITIKRD